MPLLFPLAADDGFGGMLAPLVFVLLMVAAWVFRKIVERARTLGGTGAPRPANGKPLPSDPEGASRPDVVYGSRPLVHPPRAPRAVRAAGTPSTKRRSFSAAPAVEAPTGGRDAGGRARVETLIDQIGTSAPTAAIRLRGEGRGRRLLGLSGAGLDVRDATRRGILWAEVLGSPRAIRGPHRHRFP